MTLAAALALAPDAVRAEDCPASTRTILRIERQSTSLSVDYALGIAEIARAAMRPADAVRADGRALGVFASRLRYGISLSDEHMTLGAEAFCATPRELVLRIGYVDKVIHVAKQLQDDACLTALVVDHEKKHVVADEAALQRFLGYFRDDLQLALVELRVPTAPTAAVAQNAFIAAATALVDRTMPALAGLREQHNAATDAPDEIARLTDGCEARGARLARQALGTP